MLEMNQKKKYPLILDALNVKKIRKILSKFKMLSITVALYWIIRQTKQLQQTAKTPTILQEKLVVFT